MEKDSINTHAHCFTIDHVPENFFDELIGGKHFLRISKIRNSAFLRGLIKLGTSAFMRWLVGLVLSNAAKKMRRLHGLIKYSLQDRQEELVNKLDEFYEGQCRYVLLSMDMKYMAAGESKFSFLDQVKELKELKTKYPQKVYPFVFADPRRENVTSLVKEALNGKLFQGIKLYPALGYYPFDAKLFDIYKFAIEHNIPVITHCIVGDVYYRGNYWEENPTEHPITKKTTIPETNKLFKTSKYKDPSMYQLNFTHPLNFQCLLDPSIANEHFQTEFSKLKICLGHFGGEEEWGIHATQERGKEKKYKQIYATDPLDINQNWLGEKTERYNWLTIIKALIKKYPNVYADISFTLHDKSIYKELSKMLLDPDLKNKILFGTDYYVTATVAEESEVLTLMKQNLSPAEIKLIAYDNPRKFLSSDLSKI